MLALALVALVAVARSAPLMAQSAPVSCAAGPSRVGIVSGRRIDAVLVSSRGPSSFPGALGATLHVTTRDATIRSRLLFAPGDSVDTLRVAESVRQLRRLRYLAGAIVTASCNEAGGVVLTVATRDAWSMKPRLSGGGAAGAVAGLEETNLLGTGRAVRVYARSDRGQFVLGAGYGDPTLFGARVLGTVSHDAYRDGGAWNASLGTKDVGVFERWGFKGAVRQSARQSVTRPAGGIPGDTVHRASASLLVRRRLAFGPAAGTFLLVGGEAERTTLVAAADLPLAGPHAVRRTFAGVDLGLARRTGRYAMVPWLLPQPEDEGAQFAPAEIPIGFEAEGVVGLGRDLVAHVPESRTDLWAGRVWRIGEMGSGDADSEGGSPRALVSSDLWASGYRSLGAGGGEWSAGSLRGSVAFVAPARRGLWAARASAERLVDPDPDVRSLTMADPAWRALPRGSRLAETAVSASIDRSVHLLGARRGYVLDGAFFGAGSARWDGAAPLPLAARSTNRARPGFETPETAGSERLYVASLGMGLRLTPTRFGRSTLSLDIGFPVIRSAKVLAHPYVGLSITPAFGSGRRRDGTTP